MMNAALRRTPDTGSPQARFGREVASAELGRMQVGKRQLVVRCALGLVVAISGMCAFAANVYRSEPVTAHWTGAKNSYWRDPGNWRIEGMESHPEWEGKIVPGVFTNASYVTNYGNMGHKADCVIFDAADFAASFTSTNIYLTDMVAISNVTVRGASTPQLNFASGPLQMVQGSTLKIEMDVPKAPTLSGGLAIGTYATQADGNFTLWNDSPSDLKINNLWGLVYNDPDGGYTASGTTVFYIAGRGDVQFGYNADLGKRSGVRLESHQTGNGKIVFSSPWAPNLSRFTVDRPDQSLQLVELRGPWQTSYQDPEKYKAGLNLNVGNTLALSVKNGSLMRIVGEPGRKLKFYSTSNVMGYVSVDPNSDLQIDAEIDCDVNGGSKPTHGLAPVKKSNGTIRLTNAGNAFAGEPELAGGVWETASLGTTGNTSPLGTASRIISSAFGTLRYTGAGETTTRGIRFTKKNGCILDNAGTGDLFIDSDVLCEDTSGATSLWVSNTSPHRIVFLKPLAAQGSNLKVNVRCGTLGLTGDNGYTGETTVYSGHTLELHGSGTMASTVALIEYGAGARICGGTDTAVSRTLPIKVSADVSTLDIVGLAHVTLSSLTFSDNTKTLRIFTDNPETTVAVAGKTSKDAVPSNLMFNGCADVRFDDEGRLVCEHTVTGDVDVRHDGKLSYVLGSGCTYTGKTVLDGANGATIYATMPSSIPNYDKVEASGGAIVVPVAAPDGSPAWTDADILNLANEGTFKDSAVVSVDTTKSGDHTITLTEGSVTSPTFGIGSSGLNKLTITGSSSQKINFAANNGTLEFKNANVRLGKGLMTADAYGRGQIGTVIFDHTTAKLSDSEEPISVGGRWQKATMTSDEKAAAVGKLVIRDSTLVNGMPSTVTDAKKLNFAVGGYQTAGRGIVEIGGVSTVVTALFCVASTAYGDGAAVYQRGGTVMNRLESDQDSKAKPFLAYMGSGEWNLFNGSYVSLGTAYWAANQSCLDALFMQYGGTSCFVPNGSSGNFFVLGSGNGSSASSLNGGRAHLYVAGGTCLISNMTVRIPNSFKYGYGEMIVDGPTAEIIWVNGSNQIGYTDNSRAVFTANNGGCLTFSKTFSNYKAATDIFFNLNGGVLRSFKNSGLGLGASAEGKHSGRITVYEKGATFDAQTSLNAYLPIVRPTGKGVKSVVLKKSADTYMSPVGAPGLLITGGNGDGATALAQFDPETRSVTNVIITCPGWGYTGNPTVNIRYACSSSSSHLEKIELMDLVGGGITKTGPAELGLYATNTYAGATVIREGTLSAQCDGAIPAGTDLVLAGGTLDLNGHAASFSSVSLKGAGQVFNASKAAWPTDWSVDVSEKSGYEFADVVAFPAQATLTVKHPELLDANKTITVLRLKGGYVGNLPTLVGFDPEWKVRLVGDRVRLGIPRGYSVIVR